MEAHQVICPYSKLQQISSKDSIFTRQRLSVPGLNHLSRLFLVHLGYKISLFPEHTSHAPASASALLVPLPIVISITAFEAHSPPTSTIPVPTQPFSP